MKENTAWLVKLIDYLTFIAMGFMLAVFLGAKFGEFWISEDSITLFFMKVIGGVIGAYIIAIFILKKDYIKQKYHWILISALAISGANILSVGSLTALTRLLVKIVWLAGPIIILYTIKKIQGIKIRWYYYLIFTILIFLSYTAFYPIQITDTLSFGL